MTADEAKEQARLVIASVAYDSARCDHVLSTSRRVTFCLDELEQVIAGLLLKVVDPDVAEEPWVK